MLRIRLAVLPIAFLVLASLRGASPTSQARPDANLAVRNQPRDLSSSLQHDLEDGQLDEFTLFQAVLVAGGVESRPELQQRTTQFNEIRRALANELASITDLPSKLDWLLRRLHERLLTGEYRTDYSELPRTLVDGHYNCVTATILFQALGDGCGIKTIAITTQSHVLCCVPGNTTLYVETTCREWRSAAVDRYPPRVQEQVRDGRNLSSAQLLGKVYYNLGITALESGDFSKAAERFRTASQLDHQDQAARENLLATYNNWALAEFDEGRFLSAKELLLRGLAIDPSYGPLLANDLHIHQQWIKRLCDAGDFSTAIELLEQGFLRRPDSELFDRGRVAVYELWAKQQLDLLQADL